MEETKEMSLDERSKKAQEEILAILEKYQVSLGVQTNPIIVERQK